MDIYEINACVYTATLLFFIIKERQLNLYIAAWILYTIIAVCGYYCVKSGVHYSGDTNLGYKVSPIPYFFIYLSTHIITYPIKKIKTSQINWSFFQSKKLDYIILLSTFVFIALTILKISETIVVSSIGFGEAYISGHKYHESLFNYTNTFLIYMNGWGATYYRVFEPIYILYFANRIVYTKGSVILNVLGVIIGFLPAIFIGLSNGSKGSLFFTTWDMLFYYIFFKNLMSEKIKKGFFLFGAILILYLITFVVAIQTSRNELRKDETSANETIFLYLGEAMPNVGWHVFEKVKHHPMGRRFFPELYLEENIEEQYISQADGFDYWSKETGVRIQYFTTLWGDCYIEFGYCAIFYIMIIAFLWYKLVCKKYEKIYYLPLIFYYYHMFVIYGVFNHGFSGSRTHYMFILLIIICYFIYKLTIKEKRARANYSYC